MSFSDPYDVSNDVILSHVKISTGDMMSVFPCTEFILNRRLRWKPWKGPQMNSSCFLYGWLNTAVTKFGSPTTITFVQSQGQRDFKINIQYETLIIYIYIYMYIYIYTDIQATRMATKRLNYRLKVDDISRSYIHEWCMNGTMSLSCYNVYWNSWWPQFNWRNYSGRRQYWTKLRCAATWVLFHVSVRVLHMGSRPCDVTVLLESA